MISHLPVKAVTRGPRRSVKKLIRGKWRRVKNSSDRDDGYLKTFRHFASQIFQGIFLVSGKFISDFLLIWNKFNLKLHDQTIAVQPGANRKRR
jgi:hypothetical protein